MRGISEKQAFMLSLISPETRVPKDHPGSQRLHPAPETCAPISESQDKRNQRFGSGYVTKFPTNRKASERCLSKALIFLAGGKGVEPLFTESESIRVVFSSPIVSITSQNHSINL